MSQYWDADDLNSGFGTPAWKTGVVVTSTDIMV
jgi:hypothetical protein